MAMSYSYDIQAKVFDRVKVDHSTITALVHSSRAQLEEFGAVVFKPWHDDRKLVLLNERQAIFLLRNTRKAYFRRQLIKAFGEFKWQNRATLATQLAAEQTKAASVQKAVSLPKPRQAKPKQTESASWSGFGVESVDGKPSVGVNSLPVSAVARPAPTFGGDLATFGGDESVVTMTSLEMVEFINSQRAEGESELLHKNFMAKVPKVLGQSATAKLLAFVKTPIPNGGSKQLPIYKFPKREACLMAMSYSYELQAKVFDRMTALEQQTSVNPANLSRLQLIEMALHAERGRLELAGQNAALIGQNADLIEQKAVVVEQLSIAAPKAKTLDQIATADGSICISNAAKWVGIRQKDAFSWLYHHGWIFKRGGVGPWVDKDDKLVQGLLKMKVSTIEIKDGREIIKEGVRMTPKGLTEFATLLGVAVVCFCYQEIF